MNKLTSKIVLAALTFLIGVGAFGLWYLSRFESQYQKSISEAYSSVTPLIPGFENACDFRRPSNRDLSGEEAVYVAECFIVQNGYTDLPPLADSSKLTPENLFPGTDEEGMKMRHDSLERKAFSYYRSEMYGGSWIVMFRYKPHPKTVEFYGDRINQIGRAVSMDFYGKELRVQHSDYPLRMPEAKVIDR